MGGRIVGNIALLEGRGGAAAGARDVHRCTDTAHFLNIMEASAHSSAHSGDGRTAVFRAGDKIFTGAGAARRNDGPSASARHSLITNGARFLRAFCNGPNLSTDNNLITPLTDGDDQEIR